MRIARNTRALSATEIYWAATVFDDSLPAWGRIMITDGLGPVPTIDRPYTEELNRMYFINVGPDYYPDLTRNTSYGFGMCLSLLIHEMTHVWQYYHGYWVVLRSLWANQIGKGYDYTVEASDAWNDYNVEQQAQLVKDWFAAGRSVTDDRFVFVQKIIRSGITGGMWADILDETLIRLPLQELRRWSG